jgi:hypothetical protein
MPVKYEFVKDIPAGLRRRSCDSEPATNGSGDYQISDRSVGMLKHRVKSWQPAWVRMRHVLAVAAGNWTFDGAAAATRRT